MTKIKCYTDGACSGNPGAGGWGYAMLLSESVLTFSGGKKYTTNNEMELTAVVHALQDIEKLDIDDLAEIEILSDSAYVINAINQHWLYNWCKNGWKTKQGADVKNCDLWKKLINILKDRTNDNITVKFTKVKGHAGNTFNELVDRLAVSEISKYR
jgi:ribonuclease HI